MVARPSKEAGPDIVPMITICSARSIRRRSPRQSRKLAKRRRRGQTVQDGAIWTDDQSLMVRAMVLAGDKLVVAGPPEPGNKAADSLRFVDEADALATLRGEKGVFLQVRAVGSGEILSQCELEAMPAFDGMSVAEGRLFVALKNGHVVCFAGQGPKANAQ